MDAILDQQPAAEHPTPQRTATALQETAAHRAAPGRWRTSEARCEPAPAKPVKESRAVVPGWPTLFSPPAASADLPAADQPLVTPPPPPPSAAPPPPVPADCEYVVDDLWKQP